MSRTMALDWGEKRIGVAITDPLNLTAQPLAVLPNSRDARLWESLRKLILDNDVEKIVIGIPLRTDGTEGEKAARVRNWITAAREKLRGVVLTEIDERFTTLHAQRLLHASGMKSAKQKKVVDKIAAALILEQFLTFQRSGIPPREKEA